MLSAHVPAEETICIPAPSSFSLACALARLGARRRRYGLALRQADRDSGAAGCSRSAACSSLSADATTPAAVARYLSARGFGRSVLHVLEALGGQRERIREYDRRSLRLQRCRSVESRSPSRWKPSADAKIIPLASGLADEMFEHDGQITKREIRAVTLSSLEPRAGELLWDIGCGSGSVAIEWLLRHPANRAIGIERDAAARRPCRAQRRRARRAAA